MAFARQYPKWLFPGKTDIDPSRDHIREEGVLRILDSMNPLTWLRCVKIIIKNSPDLVIIPSGCAPADIDRVWPTLDITTHRPTTILLTQVDLRTVLSSGVREVLTEAGAPVLQTIARKRQAITAAFGTAPRKLFDYADVYAELHAAMTSDHERKAL